MQTVYLNCILPPDSLNTSPPMLYPFLNFKQLTQSKQCHLHVHVCEVIQWGMDNLLVGTPPKKLPIASQLRTGLCQIFSYPCWSLSGLMLYRSYVDNDRFHEFVCAMATPCPEDSISQCSTPSSGFYILSVPLFYFVP